MDTGIQLEMLGPWPPWACIDSFCSNSGLNAQKTGNIYEILPFMKDSGPNTGAG